MTLSGRELFDSDDTNEQAFLCGHYGRRDREPFLALQPDRLPQAIPGYPKHRKNIIAMDL
jgi:hypothetical protein